MFSLAKQKKEVELKILNRCLHRYRILIIRNKISYSAYMRRETVEEMVLQQILKTYHLLGTIGVVKVSKMQENSFDKVFNPHKLTSLGGQKYIMLNNVL